MNSHKNVASLAISDIDKNFYIIIQFVFLQIKILLCQVSSCMVK